MSCLGANVLSLFSLYFSNLLVSYSNLKELKNKHRRTQRAQRYRIAEGAKSAEGEKTQSAKELNVLYAF